MTRPERREARTRRQEANKTKIEALEADLTTVEDARMRTAIKDTIEALRKDSGRIEAAIAHNSAQLERATKGTRHAKL